MSEVLLEQLVREVKSLRARMNALETAEVIPSQLQASDGDPNPALSADASGNLTAVGNIYLPDGGAIGISGNELLTVNAAGNFVFSGANVIIGTTTMLQNVVNAQVNLAENAYFDGANWKYMTSSHASAIRMWDGTLQIHLAASGTAGNTITNWDTTDVKLAITIAGAIKIPNLAGVGSRTVKAAADGTLSAP